MNRIVIRFDGEFNETDLTNLLVKGKKITAKKLSGLLPKTGLYITEMTIENLVRTKDIENRNGNISIYNKSHVEPICNSPIETDDSEDFYDNYDDE